MLGPWYLPDAEEAQDMVDAEGVEVASLLLKALPPPAKVLCLHRCPVVGGEAPVLPIGSEVIGGRPCGLLGVEKVRSTPYIHAMRCYSNGEVALEEDSSCFGIATYLLHLSIEDELQPVVIADSFGVSWVIEVSRRLVFVIDLPSSPLCRCARAEVVT